MTAFPSRTVRVLCRSCGYQHHGINPGWIRRAREVRGLSLKELAKLIGKSPQYLCDIEGGNRRAGRALGELIFKTLGGAR